MSRASDLKSAESFYNEVVLFLKITRSFEETSTTPKTAEKWIKQRDVVAGLYDEGCRLADKYGIPQDFYPLIDSEQQQSTMLDRAYIFSDSYRHDLQITFTRLFAEIRKSPSALKNSLGIPALVWNWLDKRGIAKWMVAIAIILVALSVLKRLGYDMTTLIELVKAARG